MFNCTSILRRTCSIRSNFNRNLRLDRPLAGTKTYEGEGKTTIHILNNEADLGLMINGYSQVGFRLNNGMTVLGPMIIFPRSVLSWNILRIEDVNEESLSLFSVLVPKPDILVVGVGDRQQDLSVYKTLLPLGRKLRISLEILPTPQACATFNFLSSESRCVAGAMIPPENINSTDDDKVVSKLQYENLFETDDFKLV